MHTMNQLITRSLHREIARAASHPSRLMAHELRLARRRTLPSTEEDPA